MDYSVYKMDFKSPVHFGEGTLDSSSATCESDTLFSAMCQEAVRSGRLDGLMSAVESGGLVFSGGLPYSGDTFMLPKPLLSFDNPSAEGDSVEKKAFKKISFIPLQDFKRFAEGKYSAEDAKKVPKVVFFDERTRANVDGGDETLPYRVGSVRFKDKCGLYMVIGTRDNACRTLFDDLMEALSYEGIGGKRSSGFGRFELKTARMPDELQRALTRNSSRYMLLNDALPSDDEIESAMDGAAYTLVKKSGFVSSPSYADTNLRKRDAYLFGKGSVFCGRFAGCVLDVSAGGTHPVYRYARALMLGV